VRDDDMNEKKFTKLEDDILELVSGGKAVTSIEGFSYSVSKNNKNKIFKYEVFRGDETLMS
jgi:2',3'-cyclic-nucleotide 2'-phosphodiesterase (5'-nucleotidase family)